VPHRQALDAGHGPVGAVGDVRITPIRSTTVSTARAHARLAALKRHRGADDPDVVRAERDLQVAVLADHLARVLSADPPLTPEQHTRLLGLLGSPATRD
jgi:hypothetical protein